MTKDNFVSEAETMYEELRSWRASNPSASFDEIAEAVREKRQELMGGLLKELAEQEGIGDYLEDRTCSECGGVMHYKGERKRGVGHSEGATALERGYHRCDQCGHTFFPSG
jgi:hypothetical protein